MKTTDLRNTILILAGILLGTFLLSGWWVSRQVVALKEATQALLQTRAAHEKEKVQFAELRLKREIMESECAIIQASIGELKKQFRACREHFPPPLMLRAKRGFNAIEEQAAKGEYADLVLTDGYMELKQFFNSPEFQLLLHSNEYDPTR